MFDRIKSFTFRFKPMAMAIALAVIVTAGFAVGHAVRLRNAGAASSQIVTALNPAGFVPLGLPVRLQNLSAEASTLGKQNALLLSALKARVIVTGNDKINSLNLMVFEFDENTMLRRVDGFTLPVELTTGRPVEISLPLSRRIQPNSRLVLSVERADGESKGWEMNPADLVRGSAAVAVNGTPPGLIAREGSAFQPDTGAALCSNGFRRALALAQLGDKAGVTSFTCDQQEGSFTFTFQAKRVL